MGLTLVTVNLVGTMQLFYIMPEFFSCYNGSVLQTYC